MRAHFRYVNRLEADNICDVCNARSRFDGSMMAEESQGVMGLKKRRKPLLYSFV